ncbi:hypothetical protein BGZ68_002637 [Mortierella alpina]|nr:hypothetical protein BGZ68_002637 [Mortierella alpina]
MKNFFELSILLGALLSITAAPISNNDITTIMPYSSDADIAAFYFKGCIAGTATITPLENGASEYRCSEEPGTGNQHAKHNFSTTLLVYTDTGAYHASAGEVVSGNVKGVQYAATLDSDWGTSRTVVYPMQPNPESVENLGRVCSGDEVFCFDMYDGICEFGYANRIWARACPILMVIDFSVDA